MNALKFVLPPLADDDIGSPPRFSPRPKLLIAIMSLPSKTGPAGACSTLSTCVHLRSGHPALGRVFDRTAGPVRDLPRSEATEPCPSPFGPGPSGLEKNRKIALLRELLRRDEPAAPATGTCPLLRVGR